MEKNKIKKLFTKGVDTLNNILKDDKKKALIHIAVLDLIEKANTHKWAENEKLYEACEMLLEINKELSKK